jgi:uncharacterized membrane protein YqjE
MPQGTIVEGRGLLETLGDMAANLVSMAHTRLDLLSTDLEEDRDHLLTLTITALSAVFFLGMAVVLASILLVVIFWDTHRVLILLLLVGAFLAAGAWAARRAKQLARSKPRFFASSLSELHKDREQLVSLRG